MAADQRPFRYRLSALLKRTEWERDALTYEGIRAQRVLDVRRKVHETVLDVIVQVESELRALYASPDGIILERCRILEAFLKDQRAVELVRREEVKLAQALCNQVATQLEAKRSSVKVLEKHSERSERAHDSAARRSAQNAADDSWLLRRGKNED